MDITKNDIKITLTVSAGTREEDMIQFLTNAANGWVSGLLVAGVEAEGLDGDDGR